MSPSVHAQCTAWDLTVRASVKVCGMNGWMLVCTSPPTIAFPRALLGTRSPTLLQKRGSKYPVTPAVLRAGPCRAFLRAVSLELQLLLVGEGS